MHWGLGLRVRGAQPWVTSGLLWSYLVFSSAFQYNLEGIMKLDIFESKGIIGLGFRGLRDGCGAPLGFRV